MIERDALQGVGQKQRLMNAAALLVRVHRSKLDKGVAIDHATSSAAIRQSLRLDPVQQFMVSLLDRMEARECAGCAEGQVHGHWLWKGVSCEL